MNVVYTICATTKNTRLSNIRIIHISHGSDMETFNSHTNQHVWNFLLISFLVQIFYTYILHHNLLYNNNRLNMKYGFCFALHSTNLPHTESDEMFIQSKFNNALNYNHNRNKISFLLLQYYIIA